MKLMASSLGVLALGVAVLVGPACAPGGGTQLVVDSGTIVDSGTVVDAGSDCASINGSLTVTGSADWENLADAGAVCITGELIIDTGPLTTLGPPAPGVVSVGGLRVENTHLQSFDLLPGLQTVARDVMIRENWELTAISLPALVSAGGVVTFGVNPRLASIDLPLLWSADRYTSGNLPSLVRLSLPSLSRLSSRLSVVSNPTLTDVSLPRLQSCPLVQFDTNAALVAVNLPALAGAESDAGTNPSIVITSNVALENLSVPALTRAGVLNINDNRALSTVALPSLGSVSEALFLNQNASLRTIDFPALTNLSGNVEVADDPALERLAFPVLGSLANASLNVRRTPALVALELPSVAGSVQELGISESGALIAIDLSQVTRIDTLGILNDVGLTSLRAPRLTYVGFLYIDGAGSLPAVDLPVVESAGYLWITRCAAVTSINLPELKSMSQEFLVALNPGLAWVNASKLQNASGVTFGALTSLGSLSFPSLTSLGSQGLTLQENPALTTLSLPLLRQCQGMMSVTKNQALKQCVVDGLKGQLTSGPTQYVASGNTGTPNTCP